MKASGLGLDSVNLRVRAWILMWPGWRTIPESKGCCAFLRLLVKLVF